MRRALWTIREVARLPESPVARLEATDPSGHVLRIELPRAWLEDTKAGDLMVLDLSLHRLDTTSDAKRRDDEFRKLLMK